MPFPPVHDHQLILTQPSGNRLFGLCYRGNNREVGLMMHSQSEGWLPPELVCTLDGDLIKRRYQVEIIVDVPNVSDIPPYYVFWEFFGRDRQAQLAAAEQTVAWLNEHLRLDPPLQLVVAEDFQARLDQQAARGGKPESIFDTVYRPLGEKS